MRRRSFASKGSRAGEAERTSYEVAKWPQGAAFATSAKFLGGVFLKCRESRDEMYLNQSNESKIQKYKPPPEWAAAGKK